MAERKAAIKKVLADKAEPSIAAGSASDHGLGIELGSDAETVRPGWQLHRKDPQERIALVRQGIPATMIGDLSARMGMSKAYLLSSLGLSQASISRKERATALLSRDETERVLGVENLIGIVQTMVEQSGDPVGFDAPRWLSDWLSQPLPALAGATPASYLDTFEGQKLVADLLAMSQSGAYA